MKRAKEIKTNVEPAASADPASPAKGTRSEKWEQWAKFDAKQRKFRPDESRIMTTIRNVHELQRQALWFAEHTPVPFHVEHSEVVVLAGLTIRYLCELARLGNLDAIRNAGNLSVDLAELLDELLNGESPEVEERADELRGLAERLPYWPILHFKHRQAVNHFDRLADRLHLGRRCWLKVDERANYSLQTPINRLLWRCIRHFQEIHDIVRYESGEDSPPRLEDKLRGYVFDGSGSGMIQADEIPIYRASLKLKRLTKDNVREWVEVAFLPWIRGRQPDFRQIRGFAGIDTGPRGQRYAPARRKLIEALRGLAPLA